jgi:hypothetical protein
MASQAPSRFNNYRTTSTTELTSDIWNQTVGDLAGRMAAVEVKATGYDQIVTAGIGVALDRINLALAPATAQVALLIKQTSDQLTAVNGQSISASFITPTTDAQFVTAAEQATIASVAPLVARIAALESTASGLTASRSYFLSNS